MIKRLGVFCQYKIIQATITCILIISQYIANINKFYREDLPGLVFETSSPLLFVVNNTRLVDYIKLFRSGLCADSVVKAKLCGVIELWVSLLNCLPRVMSVPHASRCPYAIMTRHVVYCTSLLAVEQNLLTFRLP